MNINFNQNSHKNKSKKRPGRGISAGQGKTAGRGTKGQKSRAGHNIPNQFEGGQSNLSLRLPKIRGFKSHNKSMVPVSLSRLSQLYKEGEVVNHKSLVNLGVIKKSQKAKILNNGAIDIFLKIEGVGISNSAKQIIENNHK